MGEPVDKRSQTTRNRMNERPFLKVGLSMSDVNRFKEDVDLTKYQPKPKRVFKRDAFSF